MRAYSGVAMVLMVSMACCHTTTRGPVDLGCAPLACQATCTGQPPASAPWRVLPDGGERTDGDDCCWAPAFHCGERTTTTVSVPGVCANDAAVADVFAVELTLTIDPIAGATMTSGGKSSPVDARGNFLIVDGAVCGGSGVYSTRGFLTEGRAVVVTDDHSQVIGCRRGTTQSTAPGFAVFP